MSIHHEILDRVGRGMLFPVLPRARGATIRRVLFVSEGLHAVLTSAKGDEAWERRVAELSADLEVFVEARTIDPKYLSCCPPPMTQFGKSVARVTSRRYASSGYSHGRMFS